ncbi:hypothetical protein ACB094_05G101400 [Castanea mollissima]
MGSYSYNSKNSSYGYNNQNPSFGPEFQRLFDPFSNSLGGFNGVLRGGPALSHSLVLDSEKGELVKAPARVGKKGVSEAKALAALKSHSEAERRRRERINAHLTTLRSLVPCTDKMDKATLLAEVISQVKELKKTACEESQGFLIPMDDDEVKVEICDDGAEDGAVSYRASLCCDYRPQLLSDLRQAIDNLQLELVKSEISTLGSRVTNAFVYTCRKAGENTDMEQCRCIANRVHDALNSVLEKAAAASALPEYSPRTLPSKRRRTTCFDTSCSSS